jgi:hypothetical protein
MLISSATMSFDTIEIIQGTVAAGKHNAARLSQSNAPACPNSYCGGQWPAACSATCQVLNMVQN